MAVKVSKGLADHLVATGSLRDALEGGLIHVFKGTAPETPEAAVSSSDIIWTISLDGDGTGLSYSESAVERSLVKPDSDVWSGRTWAGTAKFFRIVGSGDDGVSEDSSETLCRIQGTVGTTTESDMFMTNTAIDADENDNAKLLVGFTLTVPRQ